MDPGLMPDGTQGIVFAYLFHGMGIVGVDEKTQLLRAMEVFKLLFFDPL